MDKKQLDSTKEPSKLDKLVTLECTLPHLQSEIERAKQVFVEECLQRKINPHLSKVHTFNDTIAQAYVLASTGKTPQEIYNIAYLTFCSHAFDDLIETATEIKQSLSFKAQVIKEMMTAISPNSTNHLTEYMTFGAQIQQAKTRREQQQKTMEFRERILGQINNTELKKALSKIHPALLALSTHTAMGGFFTLETNTENPLDLGALYDIYYAPALYRHDDAEEIAHEGSQILYGKELCTKNKIGLRRGTIKDEHLCQMIDLFDFYVNRIPDNRRQEHATQRKLVYRAFANSLPPLLKSKYQHSLK
jgi:hypothetical protein